MKLYDPPLKCPVCSEELRAVRLVCGGCGTAIEGDFRFSKFSRVLTTQQQEFAISFLKASGNIKSMEKIYGISYPTVRARIDEIITALGEKPIEDDEGRRRRQILQRLAAGEIDADAAKALLENDEM